MESQLVGQKIRSIRINLGLNMSDFGQLFDPSASKSVVCNWEANRNKPNLTRLKKIAKHGNITVDELLHDSSKTCLQCQYELIKKDYKFCPICGLKVEV